MSAKKHLRIRVSLAPNFPGRIVLIRPSVVDTNEMTILETLQTHVSLRSHHNGVRKVSRI